MELSEQIESVSEDHNPVCERAQGLLSKALKKVGSTAHLHAASGEPGRLYAEHVAECGAEMCR